MDRLHNTADLDRSFALAVPGRSSEKACQRSHVYACNKKSLIFLRDGGGGVILGTGIKKAGRELFFANLKIEGGEEGPWSSRADSRASRREAGIVR